MASIRTRQRADGTIAYAVLYTFNGRQTAATFDTLKAAEQFRDAINTLGAERAMKAWDIAPTARARQPSGPTVSQWLDRYIASRTGVTKSTLYDYRAYLRLDINPTIGPIPLAILSRDDVAEWIQGLEERDLAGKTIANRHGFLSAALNTAVKAGLIPSNPAAGTRLPRTERAELCFLTGDEYAILRAAFTPRWRPMADFLVTSGVRLGELCALKPSDVDVEHGTVLVFRSRKRTYDANRYEVGVTKTKKSERLINVNPAVLKRLDYTGEWLFTNTVGKPLDASSFRNNVWYPAVKKAQGNGLKKKPRIHDMRHTCASWMIGRGAPLPTIQWHLGHESISTTVNLYGHLDRKAAEAAAASIAAILPPFE